MSVYLAVLVTFVGGIFSVAQYMYVCMCVCVCVCVCVTVVVISIHFPDSAKRVCD